MEEENKISIVILSKFNAQSFPLNDKAISVTQEELEQIGVTKCFDVENNCIVDYDNSKDLLVKELKRKIEFRKKILCDTDYKAIKYAEGVMSAKEYAETKNIREEARKQINMLEEELKLYE